MLWQSNSKISDTNMALFKTIGALTPETEVFLNKQNLTPLAKHYNQIWMIFK